MVESTTGLRVSARRPFGYGNGQLSRGQIFPMAGALNDEKLIRLGYVETVADGYEGHVCAICGAEFVGIPERTAHGRLAHADLDDDARADRLEREHVIANEVAPINLKASKASKAL